MKKILIIVFITLLSCNQSKSQIETLSSLEAEIKEKRDVLPLTTLNDIDRIIEKLKSLTLEELIEDSKVNLEDFNNFNDEEKYIQDFIKKNKEKFKNDTIDSKSVYYNNYHNFNDSLYVDYIKSGLGFFQVIKNDSTFINMSGVNYHLNKKYDSNKRDITPSPDVLSLSKIKTSKIFYKDGTVEQNLSSEYGCPQPTLDCFLIKNKKNIDSIKISCSIDFVSKIDSITVKKEDVGKTIKGIKIIDFNDNYIFYEASDKIGNKVLVTGLKTSKALDKNKNQIDSRQSFKNVICGKNIEEAITFENHNRQNEYRDLKEAKTKEEGLKIIENYMLNYQLECQFHEINYCFYQGNINEYVIYLETERDVLEVDATFSNFYLNQKWYLNTHETTTDILNSNGEFVFSAPIGNLSFLSTNQDSTSNFNFIESSNNHTGYYYLDYKNKQIVLLNNVSLVKVLNENLICVYYDHDSSGFIVNENNKKITDKSYYNIKTVGKLVLVSDKTNTFDLLDQNGNPTDAKDINYIGPFYNGLAKVKKGEKFSFINDKGVYVQPLSFDIKDTYYVRHKHESFAEMQIVKKGELYGVVDIKNEGKLTIPVVYEELYAISGTDDNPAYVAKKNLTDKFYGIVGTKGNIRKPFKYTLNEIYALLDNSDF
ncbi:hypothetical protein [uncultured Olleya sp.]|uniref:hypothetical protein n=1 Tax=uncultured Olleya sp. TaxID=757243 RepID=UPI002595E0D9|nr:hypothetical protein [uncultured Olleya sp.]